MIQNTKFDSETNFVRITQTIILHESTYFYIFCPFANYFKNYFHRRKLF